MQNSSELIRVLKLLTTPVFAKLLKTIQRAHTPTSAPMVMPQCTLSHTCSHIPSHALVHIQQATYILCRFLNGGLIVN